jgi:hypothetical protein
MAVRALPRARARARDPLRAATLPLAGLCLTLIAPALDLLTLVQPGVSLVGVGLVASALGCAGVLVMWGRHPHTSWLAAASLAALANVAMRLVGADVAPILSLLAVVALGLGGAFASPPRVRQSRARLIV